MHSYIDAGEGGTLTNQENDQRSGIPSEIQAVWPLQYQQESYSEFEEQAIVKSIIQAVRNEGSQSGRQTFLLVVVAHR